MIEIRYELGTRHVIQGRLNTRVTMVQSALLGSLVNEHLSAAMDNGDVGVLSLEFADGRKVTLGDVVVREIARTVL